MTRAFVIEGVDRLGKDTLIESIQQRLGYFQVVHFQKPRILDAYKIFKNSQLKYQEDSFTNAMQMLKSSAKFIFNRSWVGEAVYGPMYRNTDSSYIWKLEQTHNIGQMQDVRLILLVEDFSKSKHFVDDGLSLGSIEKRAQEQQLFIDAFNKSAFPDKKIICVTAEDGSFRPKDDILAEATAD